MGNALALDVSVILVKCTIFDKGNLLHPNKIIKSEPNPNRRHYFLPELSFYSQTHGAVFHFLQFHFDEYNEFIKSVTFKELLLFFEKLDLIESG